MKRALTICGAWVFCIGQTFGQINITSVNYNMVSMNETNILQAVVFNNGNSVMVTASVSCRNAGGENILEAVTRPFTLVQGMNTISGVSIGFSRFVYGASSQALYLKNNGLLPSGNFVYCLKIDVMSNGEDGDILCEDFASAMDDFLNLVVPYDGDTLDTKLPVLTWTHSEPFSALARNEYYKIVVAEIRKDQSAEQAVFSNPAVFSKSFLVTHSVAYPSDAVELKEGKSYAWQVQKFSNNVMVNKTDVWSFVIPVENKKPDIKYVVLKKEYDAAYYVAYNERIFFQFDEPYASEGLSYSIYNSRHKEMKVGVTNEGRAKTAEKNDGIKHQGNNRYELDLAGYGLKTGYYYLEVLDSKNRKSVLKFFIP